MPISEISGQDLRQFIELGLAFLLSALIGLEREIRHKSAGLRTYTVVGTAASLFVLISKYGFTDVLIADRIVLDPSRVAAQIVSGIGFIGAGLIFVGQDRVRGLTTAATVWLVTGVGMACGAGLPWLALAATGGYFIVALVFPLILRVIPGSADGADNNSSDVGMFDLLKAALRQRPNYIIVGEIRGVEGAIAFQAIQTGHPVMSTFHAASVEKLIQRLTGDPINVPKTYVDNLNLVIIQSAVRRPNGKIVRRIL